jgi:ABC-type Fe3+-hydroxamate transport system substrate-binding protein
MPAVTDQCGRKIFIPAVPKRIISLVPSQTELLYELGLNDEVIGITKFCVHPDTWFRSKTKAGGTKQVKLDVVRRLRPDLIIANKEENVKEQVDELEKDIPVWVSDVNNLAEACEMIRQVATITGKTGQGERIFLEIKRRFESYLRYSAPSRKIKCCYLIWQNPLMAAGGGTFIHSMLDIAGFINVFKSHNRYPAITTGQIRQSGAEVILLSSEPFPFRQKHADELQQELPNAKILLVDGEMFSWYGSRLFHAPDYFTKLMYKV